MDNDKGWEEILKKNIFFKLRIYITPKKMFWMFSVIRVPFPTLRETPFLGGRHWTSMMPALPVARCAALGQ